MSEGESLGGFDHVRTLMTRHRQYTWWTLNASSVSAHDQSRSGTPPLAFKRTFHICKTITRIKQSGGGEPGDEARACLVYSILSMFEPVPLHVLIGNFSYIFPECLLARHLRCCGPLCLHC